jgi:putative cell wall-binding protein
VSVICVGPAPPSSTTTTAAPGTKPITRLAGNDRIATAIAVSMQNFANAGTAGAVVLSRDDSYADALAGTPLAIHTSGPLLLTPTASLDSRTQAEIQRVLPAGKTVYVLGGVSAIADSVVTSIQSLGYTVVRLAGVDRFDTAVQVAHTGLGDPTTVLEATGVNFPDALAAGAAAGSIGAAVLLTNDAAQAPETNTYLTAHSADKRYAIGGAAAAADPKATAIVGIDRYDTATKVATAFFTKPNTFGAALGTNFPDALAGGAQIGSLGGPLILVPAAAPLPSTVTTYLQATKPAFGGFVYGGLAAIGDDVKAAMLAAIS